MRNVFWTELGKETYAGLLSFYLELSTHSAIDLDLKIEKLIERLSRYNFSCPPSLKLPRYRRCVVTENASLIYEVKNGEIFIVAVVDNRADHLYF